MIIIENLMDRMMTVYQDFILRNMDVEGIYFFYKCYSISINLLGIKDERLKYKNFLWKKFLEAVIENNHVKRNKLKNHLLREIDNDLITVARAMEIISEENKNEGFDNSYLWRKGVLGFPVYELERDF